MLNVFNEKWIDSCIGIRLHKRQVAKVTEFLAGILKRFNYLI